MDRLSFENIGMVLLAGGASRRMGQDKWMLPIGKSTILEHVISTLNPIGAEVWLIAAGTDEMNDPKKFPPDLSAKFPNVNITYDTLQGIGPLGGIAVGLAACRQPYVLVAASDMPFPSIALAKALFELCRLNHVSAAIPERKGRLHPLFAVYRSDCLESLTAYIESGGRKVMDWLQTLDAAILPEKEIEQLDPEGTALFNMNRPDDYALALKIIQGKAGG